MIDKTGCIGNTIKVAAGHYVDLANPDPDAIDIETIASVLSKLCRFGGHTPERLIKKGNQWHYEN